MMLVLVLQLLTKQLWWHYALGTHALFLRPHSMDLNPIERVLYLAKHYTRNLVGSVSEKWVNLAM